MNFGYFWTGKYGFNAQDWDIIRGGTLFKTGTLFK